MPFGASHQECVPTRAAVSNDAQVVPPISPPDERKQSFLTIWFTHWVGLLRSLPLLLINRIACVSEVFQANWWMYHYGSSSPKRHIMFSNAPHICKLNLGRLLGWRSANNKDSKPCRSYIGKDGKRRFHGTKHLKKTENLGSWIEVLRVPPKTTPKIIFLTWALGAKTGRHQIV